MNYIFDKSYSKTLIKLVEYIDSTKSWDLIRKISWGSNDIMADELFSKNNISGLNLNTRNQLLSDIKFMSEFNTPEERAIKFKKYYCSTRLFDHLEDNHTKQMCQRAFNAIVNADGWEYLKTYSPNPEKGFMFDSDPEMNRLMNAVAFADDSHSGFSMAWTMRHLQQLARDNIV
jgi:hypothetical protein